MIRPPFVAVEWGTARWRARVLDAAGATLAEQQDEVALASLARDDIDRLIAGWAAAWPESAANGMLLSGMIGSAAGLVEVDRAPCPATARTIAQAARRIARPGGDFVILPGLVCRDAAGAPDVLRGEEVAAVGVAAQHARALILSVPGMHGKWLRVGDNAVTGFHTAMTVELLRAMAAATILGPLMQTPPVTGDDFQRGVAAGARHVGVARQLFGARARNQLGELDAAAASSFIAGVLVGNDVADALASAPDCACFVSGAPDVAALFCAAIVALGGTATILDDRAMSGQGFVRIAREVESS